jgi:uncharacterized protein
MIYHHFNRHSNWPLGRFGFPIMILAMLIICAGCETKTIAGKTPQIRINKAIINVEVADTEEARAQGLMFRTTLQSNAGMLFIFTEPAIPAFYMKNTALPLDIIFISAANTVVTVKQMTPFDEKTLHRPEGPSKYALEVNAGWADRHGVKKGDPVVYTNSGIK